MTKDAGAHKITYNGIEMTVAEVPDAWVRASFGYGHFPQDIQQRPVFNMPNSAWPFSPETCPTDEHHGEWINGHILVCTGCGLDCT